MVTEQIQNYVNLAAGLRRATRAKAAEAAQGLLSATGLDDVATDASERVATLAEEILAASRANRELLLNLITTEVDKAAGKVGFARAEDLDALRDEVADLRAELARQAARAATAEAAAAAAAAASAPTPAPAKKAARKPAVKKPATKQAVATKKAAPAKKAAARKASPAKKTPVKRSTAAATSAGAGTA